MELTILLTSIVVPLIVAIIAAGPAYIAARKNGDKAKEAHGDLLDAVLDIKADVGAVDQAVQGLRDDLKEHVQSYHPPAPPGPHSEVPERV